MHESSDTPSLREQLAELRDGLDRIESALIGDQAMGNPGLVPRMRSVEEKVESHDRKLLVWGSFITAALAVAEFLKEKLFH